MVSRKKVIIALVILVVVAGVFATLVSIGNKILKSQLEKALGENFRVARIGLSWGGVEADGVQVLREGNVIAKVKKLGLKADLLTIFRKTVEVSVLTIEEPDVHLEIDNGGRLLLPLLSPGDTPAHEQGDSGAPAGKRGFAVYIKQIDVKNGKLALLDRRLKELNEIQASNINLRLGKFHFPLTDDVSKVKLAMNLRGKLLSGSVAIEGSFDMMRTGFNMTVEADKVAIADLPGRGPQSRIEKVSFHASSQGREAQLVEVSDLILQKCYVRAQIDKQGKLVNPLLNVLGTETGPAIEEPRQNKQNQQPATKQTQVNIKGLQISQGEVVILDGRVSSPPHTVRLTDVSLTADQFASPPQDSPTAFECSLSVPGHDSTGVLRATGKTKLKSLDTSAKASLHGLDITIVKPYILKAGDVNVTRGALNLDLDLHINNRILNSPAKAVLKNLQFAPSVGPGEKFMSIPRSTVVDFLKANNGEIALDFIVKGSIDDPTFSVRETMVTRFAVQLADKIGLGVITAGEKLIQAQRKGLQNLGETLKETSKSLRQLFNQ